MLALMPSVKFGLVWFFRMCAIFLFFCIGDDGVVQIKAAHAYSRFVEGCTIDALI